MKELFKAIKIIDHLTLELQITREEFVKKLSAIVDKGDTGLLSSPFDMFLSDKNEFKGYVYSDGFEIKRRRKFFDPNLNFATAKGKLKEDNNTLIITTEINGFTGFVIPFYIFLILFYSFFYFNFAITIKDVFINTFFIIHAFFMFAIPFFLMKNSVKRLKYELEREFFYLTKNKTSSVQA